MTKNETTKRIITALANAPAAAIRDLYRTTQDEETKDYIKRVAAAIGVDIERKIYINKEV